MAISTTNTVTINVTANTATAVQGVGQFNTTLRQTQSVANETSHAVGGLSSSLKSLLQIFSVWQAVTIGKEQLKGIMEVGAEFEKLDNAIKRFVGEKGFEEQIGWIEKLGRASYGIANVQKAVMNLTSVGLEPTAAEMQGLIGYLRTLGRTGEHELGRVTGKMTELYQLGNVGLDDAFKELSREIPIAMEALIWKMDINPLDLFFSNFKNRSIDFKTIINAIMEYTAIRFQDGMKDTAQFWDVLVQRGRNAFEEIRKNIAQSGFFDVMRKALSDMISEYDKLQASGQVEEWANRISAALSKMFKELELGEFSIENLGEKLTKFIEGLVGSTPAIKGVGEALASIGTALGIMFSTFNMLPDFIKGAAGWGVVGAFLFGAKGAAILAGLGLIKPLLEEMAKYNLPETQKPEVGMDYAGTEGMDQGSFKENIWGPIKKYATTQGANIFAPELVYRKLDGSWEVASSAHEAYQKRQEYLAATGQLLHDANRLGYDNLVKLADPVTAMEEASQKILGLNGDGTLGDANQRATQTYAPGALNDYSEMKMAMSRASTHWEAIIRAEELAGLEGRERALKVIEYQEKEFFTDWKKARESGTAAAAKQWEIGQFKMAIDTMNILDAKEAEIKKASAERARKTNEQWDKKDAKKWSDNEIGLTDIDQNIADITKRIQDAFNRNDLAKGELAQQGAKGWSDSIKAQILAVDQKAKEAAIQLNASIPALEKAMNELWQKVNKPGKHATPEALAAVKDVLKMQEEVNKAVIENRAAIENVRLIENQRIVAIGQGQQDQREDQLIVRYMELAGGTKELAAAKQLLIEKTQQLDWLNAKSDTERQMINKIAEYEVWVQRMKQMGDITDGLRYGMHQISQTMPTMWDTGIEAAKRMKQAFDDVAGSVADLAMTGKADIWSLAQSVVRDLIKMSIQATVTNKIFAALSSVLGMGGGSGAYTAPTFTNPFNGNVYHEGGFVGGLAPDEVPAILQKGEYVVPRDQVGSLGTSVNTVINVSVEAPQGGNGGSFDSKSADALGNNIATIVKAEFNKNLNEQMRSGGMLNRGVSV
ncbi:MAG: phage tail tape measure C-terminal domain-containing protein [Syntrophobacteraceae bacterium]